MVAISLLQASAQVNSLSDYLKLDTGKPTWSVGPSNKDLSELRVNSLTWQGDQWRHEVVVGGAKLDSDTVILNLTGDRLENKMDRFTVLFSKTCKLPVATVYGVPNQPAFGLREDQLISQGMRKFFTTNDNTWPLQLPMTKSAIAAMDALGEWSKGKFKKFIVTGTSKRGATSWLVACSGDKRVIGIAPVVADVMADMAAQLEAQKAAWGQYTPMIPEFSTFDPVPLFKAPRGRQMMSMIDPGLMLDKVEVPVLSISATNDKFSIVNSTGLYWDRVKSPKLYKCVPNAPHFFSIPNALIDGYSEAQSLDAMRSIRFFAECLSGKSAGGLPDLANPSDPRRRKTHTWSVGAETQWFQESNWKQGQPPTAANCVASFKDVEYEANGYRASFSSQVKVVAK
ncbi:MAG: PhoPQ-activated pathogenicity-related family protein [Armatimonadetes bacterium]|nr:PhoPQ-activated pathogenicity-related family protein [Armatimonadota bacterium]